jgi:hypothetical protein
MAGGPTREDTFRVNVKIEHPFTHQMEDFGVWDKLDGGAIDSEDTKYYPGGMEDPTSLGGRKTTDNVTLGRLYRLERDHGHLNALIVGTGKSKVTIIKHSLDIDGNVYGSPLVYNGRLKRCTPPTHDSNASGAAMVEIEVTVDGFPTIS